jgi:hypothetical protein
MWVLDNEGSTSPILQTKTSNGNLETHVLYVESAKQSSTNQTAVSAWIVETHVVDAISQSVGI